jgi:hypothetical protein
MSTNQAGLPTFDEAVPLQLSDDQFISEFYNLLVRTGNTNRFGLTLLHDHFPIEPDEILMETHDKETRTLTLQPMKYADLGDNVKITSWKIGAGEVTDLTGCAEDKCKVIAMTGCAEDKCKVVAMTGCAEDKCKVIAMTGCAEDKCKVVAMTGCAEDMCKVVAMTGCAEDMCK